MRGEPSRASSGVVASSCWGNSRLEVVATFLAWMVQAFPRTYRRTPTSDAFSQALSETSDVRNDERTRAEQRRRAEGLIASLFAGNPKPSYVPPAARIVPDVRLGRDAFSFRVRRFEGFGTRALAEHVTWVLAQLAEFVPIRAVRFEAERDRDAWQWPGPRAPDGVRSERFFLGLLVVVLLLGLVMSGSARVVLVLVASLMPTASLLANFAWTRPWAPLLDAFDVRSGYEPLIAWGAALSIPPLLMLAPFMSWSGSGLEAAVRALFVLLEFLAVRAWLLCLAEVSSGAHELGQRSS